MTRLGDRVRNWAWDKHGWDWFREPTDAELTRWANARTLRDLGDITALWLTGEVSSTPGYCGPVDVDEDIAPGITDALIALNKAGLPTWDSRGAFEGRIYPGSPEETWGKVEATVDLFADAGGLDWITGVLSSTPFEFHLGPPGLGDRSVEYLSHDWAGYGLCHPDLVAAVCGAWQVHIFDPVPGRNTLWPVLLQAAKARH